MKRVKPVPQDSTEPEVRFGENERLAAEKRREAEPIIQALETILNERGPRVSLASAGSEMRGRVANYDGILERTHSKLIEIIRLVPERLKLVERGYYVEKA